MLREACCCQVDLIILMNILLSQAKIRKALVFLQRLVLSIQFTKPHYLPNGCLAIIHLTLGLSQESQYEGFHILGEIDGVLCLAAFFAA